MIFYLFPRDVFTGIATYPLSVLPNLEVTDSLPTQWNATLLNYVSPLSLQLEIPSAVNAVQALGYQSFAALGDAIVNPHQWTFQFPLFLLQETKNFIAFALNYINRIHPVAIWAILRSPDGQEYTHFICSIALLTNISLQFPNAGNATLSLTFSVPFARTFQGNAPALNAMRPASVNTRGLTIRDLHIVPRGGNEAEVLSLVINIRRDVNWHYTTFASYHSLVARRAATMFTVAPVMPQGNITLGYPFGFSFLQDADLKPLSTIDIHIWDLMTLTLEGVKAMSWGEDLSAANVGINLRFSFLGWEIS